MTQTSNAVPAGPAAKNPTAALGKLVKAGVDGSLAYLRKIDPDAAADVDTERRREVTRPRIVVGETKRGKSSLTNMLIGVPNHTPVDAAVATASYLEFQHNPQHGARAYVPGREDPIPLGLGDLRDWGTVLGRLPTGCARRAGSRSTTRRRCCST